MPPSQASPAAARPTLVLLRLLCLLQDCQLSVVKPNPRQYVARISQLPGLEVWFQRATGAWGLPGALLPGSLAGAGWDASRPLLPGMAAWDDLEQHPHHAAAAAAAAAGPARCTKLPLPLLTCCPPAHLPGCRCCAQDHLRRH